MRPPSIHRIPANLSPKSGAIATAAGARRDRRSTERLAYICRSTIIFLISTIAFAGFNPFGHVCAQFMIVWHL